MKKLNCKLGDTFGNWTVIDDNTFVKGGHTYVKVQCKCGKIEDKCLSDLVMVELKVVEVVLHALEVLQLRLGINIKVGL